MTEQLETIVKEEISGRSAKSFVAKISEYHRVQGSPMFHEAAEYIRDILVDIGLDDVALEQFPADGRHAFWSHVSPMGWSVRSAELRLLEPEEMLLARFEDIPQSLHSYSRATPPGGVTAELVDVGAGTKPRDYAGKDVKGKLILASGRGDEAHRMAVLRFGAAGVITDSVLDMAGFRHPMDVPDAHPYFGVWPNAKTKDRVTFGFSLNRRQGDHLRAMLRAGKTVRLNAKVDAELFEGKLDVLTATIPGASLGDEEVVLVAHLCHPKPAANDNASGSACLMEIARSIQKLISSGKMEAPRRTIRFLWVPETEGSVAWLQTHEDKWPRLVAGMNLDMVGEDQELCRSVLLLDRTPDSLPSFLNDLVFHFMERSLKVFDNQATPGPSSEFRYNSCSFSSGSDHTEFTDATVSCPCVMLYQWPDLFYHSSLDTIDKVSEDSLKRVGWITAMSALTVANADSDAAFELANATVARGMERISAAGREAADRLLRIKDDPKYQGTPHELGMELAKMARAKADRLDHLVLREQEASRSVKRLGTSPELNSFLNEQRQELGAHGRREKARLQEFVEFISRSSHVSIPDELEETSAERELGNIVPKRLLRGTLYDESLRDLLPEEDYDWYRDIDDREPGFSKRTIEILNFMDGKRTLRDIVRMVSAEYDCSMSPENVLTFLRDLEKCGFVSLR